MNDLIHPLPAGYLNTVSIATLTLAALVLSMAGGALSGMLLAGKDLGRSLAAAIGALFGPVAATPGVLFGLIVLVFV